MCDRSSSSSATAPAQDSWGPTNAKRLALYWVFPEQKKLRLDRDRIVLGRGHDADFVVGGPEASRHHAEIVRDGPLWVIRDLGSTNGIFVNGAREQRAPLGPKTVLRVGNGVAVAVNEFEGETESGALRELSPGLLGGYALQRLLLAAEPAAKSDLPIIIEGETGAGKERVAQWIHRVSGRDGPLIAINCAALPEALAEAELFGYRRGAFTGAVQSSGGYFRAARGGTLLLDEVLDLPHALQAKLLRAIEQRQIVPLGEAEPIATDVRVLAASQASLQAAVETGRFRGDLWARLDGFTVPLPPLRERPEDVAPLFSYFLSQACGGRAPEVDARLIEALSLYPWPFNVRELELLARRIGVVHGHDAVLRRSLLPSRFGASEKPAAPNPVAAPALDEYDRFLAKLREHGGVVAQAAEASGISRMRAYRLMKEHDLDLDAVRRTSEEQS
jgi:DNA-binding NtrC family response regulator